MAKIETLKDKNNETVYPLTRADAVIDANEKTVDERLAELEAMLDPLTRAESGEWVKIAEDVATTSSGYYVVNNIPLVCLIPEDYQGYGWEYRIEIAGEVGKNTESENSIFPHLEAQVLGSWFLGSAAFGYTSAWGDPIATTLHRGTTSDVFGFEWRTVGSNDSFVASVYASRAHATNFWTASSSAAGVAGGNNSAVFHGGGRLGTADDITGFRFRNSSSSIDLRAYVGTHMTVFARKYIA